MYNVADHLTRCLKSLSDQNVSTNEFEIICINDGSPDNCSNIVRDLQKEIPNIILLEQENQGVSMARNNGIAMAKGKYILPIDPDDYIYENVFADIFEFLSTTDYDAIFLDYEKYDKTNKVIWKTDYSALAQKKFTDLKYFHRSKGENNIWSDPDRSWAILYKKTVIVKYSVMYPEKVPFLEDAIFLAKFFSVATTYSFLENDFYRRTTRQGSATNSNLINREISTVGFRNGLNDLRDFFHTWKGSILKKDRISYLKQTYIQFRSLPLIASVNIKHLPSIINRIREDRQVKKIYIRGSVRYPFNVYAVSMSLSPYVLLFNYIIISRITFLIQKNNKI